MPLLVNQLGALSAALRARFATLRSVRSPAATAFARFSQRDRKSSSSSAVRCSMPTNELWAALVRISSSSLTWIAALSRFCEFWIRNTIRKVTIVVPVLITSCQVSEKPNSGPLTAQTTMTRHAITNVEARPAACDVALATLAKNLAILWGVSGLSCIVRIKPAGFRQVPGAVLHIETTGTFFALIGQLQITEEKEHDFRKRCFALADRRADPDHHPAGSVLAFLDSNDGPARRVVGPDRTQESVS